jgi:hypothetical protein
MATTYLSIMKFFFRRLVNKRAFLKAAPQFIDVEMMSIN